QCPARAIAHRAEAGAEFERDTLFGKARLRGIRHRLRARCLQRLARRALIGRRKHAEPLGFRCRGLRGGARMVSALRQVQADDPRYAGIAVQEMPCLFACAEFCTVHLRAPGKVGYVLGRFTPDADA
ncbi:DUF1636 family protein, partial [Klebsiella pneumoniae]|uniref:DUF1636 family protein n=1 Tax=Klebsiella pneumoniae TaxID=573 RepID=UPI0038537851